MRLSPWILLGVLLLAGACDESGSTPTDSTVDSWPDGALTDGRADAGGDQAVAGDSSRDATRRDAPRADGPRPADTGGHDSLVPDSAPPPDTTPPPDIKPPWDGWVPPDAPPSVCGNGVREGLEQCDDSNKVNLDGCDATCKFEQDQRVNYLLLQYATDTVCTKNAFGKAIVMQLAQTMLQQAIDDGIADGSISVLFKLLGLDDLSGTNDAALSLGLVGGTPATGTGYSGTSDLDWWYTVDPLTIDSQRVPLAQLPGKIVAKALTAGPGKLSMTLSIAGTTATLSMSGTTVSVTTGAASAPLSSSGTPPGHLAAEHLAPTLTSFASAGAKSSSGAGRLCGNASAQSLKNVPIPSALASLCQGYTTANSLLDVLVGGCTIFLLGQALAPTQPDTDDPDVAAVGAGPPYSLTVNSSKAVIGCQDKNGQSVTLSSCLADAAYSIFFKLASGRVIIK